MNYELKIITERKKHKVFLQNGFYSPCLPTHIHKHKYTEIHIVFGGNADFSIGESIYRGKSGDLIAIPGGIFHCCTVNEETARHTAFQIDCKIEDVSVHNIGADTAGDFLKEIEECKFSGDYTKIAAYIRLFCSYFCPDEKLLSKPVTDYGFLIQEFFSLRYSEDVCLCDLAEVLHLSERQTERLVIEHTGNTFRKELAATRMNIAKELLENSEMSLSEISQYVGYKTYTGFWKAAKKYGFFTV